MRQLSIVIPSWERVDMTINSFKKVHNDKRVHSIVIVDDASSMVTYKELEAKCNQFSKVSLYRNQENKDCYANKFLAVSYSPTDFCILLDSDNQIDKSYIDAIFNQEDWDWETIFQPTFARPMFDFRRYSGVTIKKSNISKYLGKPMFDTALNAMNYFVNKNKYIEVWDGNVDPHSSDSIFQNYNWLNAGYKIKFLEGMEYEHLVHDGSHYKANSHKSPEFYQEILQKLGELR
jgi:glycosyltransferase involved in cell wall biosynthesis